MSIADERPNPTAGDDGNLEALRAKLRREQLYAIHMTPVHVLEDPLEALRPKLAEHIRFLLELEASGVLFASGAWRDEATLWDGSGMAIVRAASHADAVLIAEREPFHIAGIRRNQVRGWQMNEGCITLTVRLAEGRASLG